MTAKGKPTVIAVTSDHHVGSTIGLAAPQGARTDDGQKVLPSKVQAWTWSCWLDFHGKVAERRDELGAKLIYVLNGDCVEGQHHGSTEVMAANAEDAQSYLADEVFNVVTALKPNSLCLVRGTPAHVGPSASAEEALGRRLGCSRDPETHNWTSYILRFREHGVLFDFRHHCTVGGQKWTRAGGVARLAFRHWAECAEAGDEPGDVIVRSHVHVHGDSGSAHRTRAIVTPAWQLKTSYVHKVATESIADIGGVIFTVHPSGRYEVEPVLYHPSLPKTRVL